MEAEIGARVKEALKALQPPITQQAMASRLGITPDAFSRSLSGKRAFTAVELVKLAEVLGTSAHWFVTGEPDPFAVTFAGRHTYDPIVKEYVEVDWTSTKQTRDAVAHAYIQAYGGESAQPERARIWTASEARQALENAGGVDFVRLLANNVEAAFGVDVVRLDGIEPDFALSVLGRDVVVIDASAYWFRENFSIAHELAHILLGHLARLGAKACTDKSAERAANAFAAELLSPEDSISKASWATVGAKEVAQYVWESGISTPMLRTRLSSLRVEMNPSVLAAVSEKTQVLIQRELPGLADAVSSRMRDARQRRFPEHLVSAHSRAISTGSLPADTLAWMLTEPVELIRDELAPSLPPADLDWLAHELGLGE